MFKSWKVLKTILALKSNNPGKRKLSLAINDMAVTNSKDMAKGYKYFFGGFNGPELAKDIHSDKNYLLMLTISKTLYLFFMFLVKR